MGTGYRNEIYPSIAGWTDGAYGYQLDALAQSLVAQKKFEANLFKLADSLRFRMFGLVQLGPVRIHYRVRIVLSIAGCD